MNILRTDQGELIQISSLKASKEQQYQRYATH